MCLQVTHLILIRRPCIIHQNIQPPKPLKRQINYAPPVVLFRHVHFLEHEACGILRRDVLSCLSVDVGEDDFGAFFGEATGDGGAEA